MTYTSTPVPAIAASQNQKEVTANGLFEADHPGMLFGVDLTETAGLTLGLLGGVLPVSGALAVVDNQTVALTGSATNWIYAEIASGAWVVTVATSAPPGWPDLGADMIALYKMTTNAVTVSAVVEVWRSLTAIASATSGGASGAAGGDLSGTYPNPLVAANKITVAKMHASATDVFFGRDTAGAGAGEEISVVAAKTLLGLTGTNSGDQTITITGDVTGSGTGSFAATIPNNTVTNAKAADMATATFKGRTTAGTGDPEDLTVTQATALLNAIPGDSGSGGVKGLAPAQGAGDAAAGKFLKADGTWAVPPGAGTVSALALTEAPADLAYTGITVSMTYGEPLVPGDPVFFDATGVVLKADANAAGKFPALGMAMETASSGSHVVLLHGIFRNDSLFAFTVGGLVYLSTSGGVTQTQPSATDDCIQILGVATHADRLYLNPQLNYLTHV